MSEFRSGIDSIGLLSALECRKRFNYWLFATLSVSRRSFVAVFIARCDGEHQARSCMGAATQEFDDGGGMEEEKPARSK